MFTPALYKVVDVGVPEKKKNSCGIAVLPNFFCSGALFTLFPALTSFSSSPPPPPSEEEEEDWRGLLERTLGVGSYLSTVKRVQTIGSVNGFSWEGLQRLATFDSLSVQMHLEERSRIESRAIVCYLGGIWRQLDLLEWIYGWVPNLGKPYMYRKNRLHKNP